MDRVVCSCMPKVFSSSCHVIVLHTVQSDVGKISRIHFQAMFRMLQEGTIQSPSSSSSSKQSTSQRTQGQDRPVSATTPAEHSSVKQTQAGTVQPSIAPAVISSTLPSHPDSSAPIQSNVAPRSILTPAQPSTHSHSSGLIAAQTYPPQPQSYHTATQPPNAAYFHPQPTPVSMGTAPSVPAPPSEPQTASGGLFYSRRMGGSYNY